MTTKKPASRPRRKLTLKKGTLRDLTVPGETADAVRAAMANTYTTCTCSTAYNRKSCSW